MRSALDGTGIQRQALSGVLYLRKWHRPQFYCKKAYRGSQEADWPQPIHIFRDHTSTAEIANGRLWSSQTAGATNFQKIPTHSLLSERGGARCRTALTAVVPGKSGYGDQYTGQLFSFGIDMGISAVRRLRAMLKEEKRASLELKIK